MKVKSAKILPKIRGFTLENSWKIEKYRGFCMFVRLSVNSKIELSTTAREAE